VPEECLLEDGVTPQVVPLFYRQPDGFRSEVDIMPGKPADLPPRLPDAHPRRWEKRLLAALDAVSVDCPDARSFATGGTVGGRGGGWPCRLPAAVRAGDVPIVTNPTWYCGTRSLQIFVSRRFFFRSGTACLSW
jgi:hypothetical protein